MEPDKSLDEMVSLVAALLYDVQSSHGDVFNSRALRLTVNKVRRRVSLEGMGFLTKTLPRLGKALDKALSDVQPLNAADHRFKPMVKGSNLPRFLGELFSRVLNQDGLPLPDPCAKCVASLRLVLYMFYKYKLPYEDEECSKVIDKFKRTEYELTDICNRLREERSLFVCWSRDQSRKLHYCKTRQGSSESALAIRQDGAEGSGSLGTRSDDGGIERASIGIDESLFLYLANNPNDPYYLSDRFRHIRRARALLSDLFAFFDPKDILPRHGPGAVATRQQLWAKYQWTNVSANITRQYPLDEYFYSSLGHVCDAVNGFKAVTEEDLPARVVLVPKDSRGPRLISCEPVDYQWIQQGLGRAIVKLVEEHELTKFNVYFSSQRTNQLGALHGSLDGRYSTLDLNEASDRVTVELVRLLFPKHICDYLEACRSSSTMLPSGEVIRLQKFAPMGSNLCFPILALTIWAILTAGTFDDNSTIKFKKHNELSERIAVFGDDVIVPTAYAANAIELLESYGLKINRDKSCTGGFFRESCGTDAFKGVEVTPVRLRTVWSSSRRPDVYTSWIAYANSYYDRRCYATYDLIVEWLHRIYGPIPDKSMNLKCPCLRVVADNKKPHQIRTNHHLQKRQWRVWDVKSPSINKELDGWTMLLRYFTEGVRSQSDQEDSAMSFDESDFQAIPDGKWLDESLDLIQPFAVRLYTRRRTSMLVRRWR